jgi:TRAP-type uncharacterized transport system fused permease subunit
VVFLFVLFAAFLLKSGAGEFIIKLALALMGRTTGGPAKMAVFASGIMGSISGSAVANTVGTGSITIPMMKRIGLSPKFSGGVEAAATLLFWPGLRTNLAGVALLAVLIGFEKLKVLRRARRMATS